MARAGYASGSSDVRWRRIESCPPPCGGPRWLGDGLTRARTALSGQILRFFDAASLTWRMSACTHQPRKRRGGRLPPNRLKTVTDEGGRPGLSYRPSLVRNAKPGRPSHLGQAYASGVGPLSSRLDGDRRLVSYVVLPPVSNRSYDRLGVVLLGKMLRPRDDDSPVIGE